jgi:hypothetical protein
MRRDYIAPHTKSQLIRERTPTDDMFVSLSRPVQAVRPGDFPLEGQVTIKQGFAEKQQPRQRVGVIVVKA